MRKKYFPPDLDLETPDIRRHPERSGLWLNPRAEVKWTGLLQLSTEERGARFLSLEELAKLRVRVIFAISAAFLCRTQRLVPPHWSERRTAHPL